MKWILVSNSSTGIREYHLLQDELVLIVLKYSMEQQSVRIAFGDEHFVFFMENSGYANRIVFNNAYGIELGKFSSNNRNNTGRLEINDTVYDYEIVDNNQSELIIHQHNKPEPLAVCQIPGISMRDFSHYELAGIVLSVCCYTNIPAASKMQNM